MQQLNRESVETRRRFFTDGLDEDEWVVFHGTSGFNAESIERDGFDSVSGKALLAEILRVMTVFKKMRWLGQDGGGYPVLKAFSYGYDFHASGRSPLFFAETSMRALLYSTRDFAGGEKLRAIRRAMHDLEAYLNDSALRQQHLDLMQAEFDCLSANNASEADLELKRPAMVDQAWLKQELENLSEIRRSADDAFVRHDHGLVYALRMTSDDVASLRWNPAMGVEANALVSPSKIIGKVVVPQDYELLQPSRTCNDPDHVACGLIAALRSKRQRSLGDC